MSRSNYAIHCINSFSRCQQFFKIFFSNCFSVRPYQRTQSMLHNSVKPVNKNFKNFSDKIFLTFPSRYAITHVYASRLHLHTPTHLYALFLFFLSFPVSFFRFSCLFFRPFPFFSPFLLKCLKIVHSCVSFPFPSQYTTFPLERNHERFFAVLNDFTNAF